MLCLEFDEGHAEFDEGHAEFDEGHAAAMLFGLLYVWKTFHFDVRRSKKSKIIQIFTTSNELNKYYF
jgi:hypothetical protein